MTRDELLKKLHAKGIDTFSAHDIPVAMARERYGGHFVVVERDLHQENDLRILDDSGDRAFRLFHFHESEPPIAYET